MSTPPPSPRTFRLIQAGTAAALLAIYGGGAVGVVVGYALLGL